ncbi:TPA: prolyl-tRNA synthetase [Candidatus Collierbacteria bacterium]|uniref:Proline--tRNA ligase n=1 Tax=Candidatus Collierbacteria bacterium GW2011_GWA2_42_17 TaxID=1618378 RepID=A0A0G0Z1M2_9BACT|nr:MAG: Prolyl-tRNA synthetase [Candidatus Collierbacteria bacterium GW2011_GWB2_42_12]KKS42680.1 MAG: Prolyl-tRNA synthetase [Candidatus Collierbacteria bacterium GW2011_GWA2_42_17]KKS62835.1 MAG: Prolyl-tRNA synthetase [Candidatus Collierbacteria bacterium GW2011_GWE2_42_48]KKS63211.1 MAG: Prolyl-tRNA synthetase [Candidatus Collierbacteria bacterium GW2011_GWD2_42_50]KKS63991.1 MAG: Prolyl-tRNA synthetase [Candidatus Collierbacteria bacterium GW2011_GWF2_42_51]KKS67432.1 MAG: Prolyl-tRNA syn
MKMSKMGVRPEKIAPKDAEAINHKLLVQGGFIHQEMAGVYTFLPLGLRVLNKIENIVRKHMDEIGSELLMPALSPKEYWKTTGRLETIDVLFKASAANEVSLAKSDAEYVLCPTHEDVVTPLVKIYNPSYKDLPVAVYQIQTKYRNEPRAKSGLLRCREFRMKDLYSFHANEADWKKFYEESKKVYMSIYKEIGIGKDTVIALASGGDFTNEFSHEFQTRCESGEDIVYLNKTTGVAYNKEVKPEGADTNSDFEIFNASEVGNIFPLGVKFTKAFGYEYTDKDGSKKPIIMSSYGIGTSRLMGVLVEKFHDDKGIIWPLSVAPFLVHIVDLQQPEETKKIYEKLKDAGIDALWDDREMSPGEKFADADLIGCPVRVLVSARSLQNGGVEVKRRNETENKIISVDKLMEYIKNV